MKKYIKIAMVVCAVMIAGSFLLTNCGLCAQDKPVKVNNTVCPVTGQKVSGSNPVTVEYNGKAYNLCCPACIGMFKANPEKYSKIAEEKK
ncbi:MAG: YHS domain-containing protein [Candidatus Omnitrophota bacterium]